MLTEHIQEFCQVSPCPLPRVGLGTRLASSSHGFLFSLIFVGSNGTHTKPCTTRGNFVFHWGEPERAPHRRVCCEFSIFIIFYRTSCRKSLPARILRVALIQTTNELTIVNDIDTNHANHERSTSTRMETIARGEGLKHFMKTGRVLQAISCPACRAHHGVHY